MVRKCGTTIEDFRRMLKKAVQRSVRRESLNVKGFGGRTLVNPTFHVLPFTVFESDAGGLFRILLGIFN